MKEHFQGASRWKPGLTKLLSWHLVQPIHLEVSDFFVWLDPIATSPTCYYQLERMIWIQGSTRWSQWDFNHWAVHGKRLRLKPPNQVGSVWHIMIKNTKVALGIPTTGMVKMWGHDLQILQHPAAVLPQSNWEYPVPSAEYFTFFNKKVDIPCRRLRWAQMGSELFAHGWWSDVVRSKGCDLSEGLVNFGSEGAK